MKDLKDVKNILILKWGALGDLIMATSTIKSVRENFPDAKITMFTNNLMEEIFPEGFIIDKYVFLKKTGRYVDESFFKQVRRILELKKEEFDLAIDLKWKSERASVLTLLSGAKVRIGYWEKFYNRCYTHTIKHPIGGYHEVYRNLDVIKKIDLKTNDANPLVFVSDEDKKFADNFFRENSINRESTICIHPGASKQDRTWAPERFFKIAHRLIKKFNVNILITWGSNEYERADKIVSDLGANAFLSPQTKSVGQLAAIIKNCGMFISVCTGPMNVANAVQTPIIALLGSTDPLDWSPFGEIHRTIKSPLVLECYTDEDEKRAFKEIDVESVWNVVEKRWNELKNFEN
jgi:ADP-heptose:LPS heptosyltransferase